VNIFNNSPFEYLNIYVVSRTRFSAVTERVQQQNEIQHPVNGGAWYSF